jgi:hypothetical protein
MPGFYGCEPPRILGKTVAVSEVRPTPKQKDGSLANCLRLNLLDAGLVRMPVPVPYDLKQRTTCYGNFGNLALPYDDASTSTEDPFLRRKVTKCGPEEPHGGCAEVTCRRLDLVRLLGPGNQIGAPAQWYFFRDQYLIKEVGRCRCRCQPPSSRRCCPRCCGCHWRGGRRTPFAAPGDSGTMIVEEGTRDPVGMLIGGSALEGAYVVTPIEYLRKFWEDFGLVFLRG